ncbi:MAG: hypothetical protein QM820_53585 [Minicystis sp.]
MRLHIHLLKLAARRPLLALAVATAAPVLAIGATVGALHTTPATTAEPLDNSRAVLGRVWFDRYPEKPTDEAQIWIWFAGGIGIHDTGSFWRQTTELFEFERQGDKLSMVYLQDKKKAETRFKITACEEQRPFNLCLDLTDALGGRKRYYGFGDVDDMASRIPWSKNVLQAAEARAAGPRP